MKRVADVVAEMLVDHGIEHTFMVTGGGAMHLNDAIGRCPGLTPIFCHHEQACAIAAESYGRLTHRLAAVNVTTGPGGINALNGVFGAYVDSIGMIVVSGQVKRETMVSSYDLPLRQLGDQEVNIVSLATRVTKLAVVLDDPLDVRYVMEKAIWVAENGRPGPVWIDIPIDVQSALVEYSSLRGFDPESDDDAALNRVNTLTGSALEEQLIRVLEKASQATRPVIVAGTGIRISDSYEVFRRVIEKLAIPVATAFNAHDLLEESHPLYVGRPGTVGDRAGNFAVQNADFVLILGCRLNIRQISYNWDSFAREAFTVMVDVDRAELDKPTLSIDLPVHADLAETLECIDKIISFTPQEAHGSYLAWCKERLERYPVLREESDAAQGLNDPYVFLDQLFRELEDDDVVVVGDGTACVVTFQVARLKEGQRLYSNSGCASMGYDLPAAVGAAIARRGKRVICIAGDGSIMMNIQELQTISGRRLPIKIFVLNNDGYSSIRQTQVNYFPDGLTGCDSSSGLSFPNFIAVGAAFGIESQRCDDPRDALNAIRRTLDGEGPQLLEVMLDKDRPFTPKLSSRALPDGRMVSSPLEDMAPFLSREELAENLLVAPMQEP